MVPRYVGPPSFVTVLTTPLRALPYSALNVPATTESSSMAFVAIVTERLLSNGFTTDTPLTVYWISVERPPRMWISPPVPCVMPACRVSTWVTFSTGSASMAVASMTACEDVRSRRTIGASAWTSTVSSAMTSVESWMSSRVVKSTATFTLLNRFRWSPTPEATTT